MSVFQEVAALLAIASAVGLIGVAARQPLIVSFIAVGILVGPSGFGIVTGGVVVETLARLGIALLLFLVGLKLDVGLIRSFGSVAVAAGLGQMLFTAAGGFALCLALGMAPAESVSVAVALTFSSTIIVVKLLSDKREIDALHGRIALGILIVQDVGVILAMIVLAAWGSAAAGGGAEALGTALLGALGLVAVVAVFIRWIAEPLLRRMAREAELLVVFALGWAALGAAAADALGLSKELGGLLAGVSLGSSSVREAIAARLAPLRDFLLLFFFLELGSHLDLSSIGGGVARALALSAFVLLGKPLIVLAIMGRLGYRARTGFLAGLSLAQISEFSLVFIALSLSLGGASQQAAGIVTLVGIVTIALSTYMIVDSAALHRRLVPLLRPFERRGALREDYALAEGEAPARRVVLFGLGRYGAAIAERLAARGVGFLGVDFDPDAVRAFQRRGWPAIYGDGADPTFVAGLPLAEAEWIVVAVPHAAGVLGHAETRSALLGTLRQAGFKGRVALTATSPGEEARLKALGADVVLSPFADAADEAVQRILEAAPAAEPAGA